MSSIQEQERLIEHQNSLCKKNIMKNQQKKLGHGKREKSANWIHTFAQILYRCQTEDGD